MELATGLYETMLEQGETMRTIIALQRVLPKSCRQAYVLWIERLDIRAKNEDDGKPVTLEENEEYWRTKVQEAQKGTPHQTVQTTTQADKISQ